MSIPIHETHTIIDSSKMQEYMTCPRKYFYRYVLGWDIYSKSIHLVFGEAWHRAMEVLMQQGYTGSAVKEGMERFTEYFRRYYEPYEDEIYAPKNVEYAYQGLLAYIERYIDDDFEVLHTEVHGTIPIDTTGRMLVGRIDSICKDKNGYFSLEHKTGSRLSAVWTEQWTMKVQIGTYLHALYLMYPEKDVYGILVNGVFFLKTMFKFERVPVRKLKNSMQVWLTMVNHYYNSIESDMELMRNEEKEDKVSMESFPMNTESCMNYMRPCKYIDFCKHWNNPLQRCDECPAGFEQIWWNPADSEKKSTKMVGGKIVK